MKRRTQTAEPYVDSYTWAILKGRCTFYLWFPSCNKLWLPPSPTVLLACKSSSSPSDPLGIQGTGQGDKHRRETESKTETCGWSVNVKVTTAQTLRQSKKTDRGEGCRTIFIVSGEMEVELGCFPTPTVGWGARFSPPRTNRPSVVSWEEPSLKPDPKKGYEGIVAWVQSCSSARILLSYFHSS